MVIEAALQSKARKEGSFFDTSSILRGVIFLILAAGIFSFFHYREIRSPVLELGTLAPRYIVAEVTFSFPDEDATSAARQAALFDVGNIYQIEPEDILKRSMEFENALLYDQSWRVASAQSTFEEMCRANDQLAKALLESKFSDARTIERMRKSGLDITNFHAIVPTDFRQGICFPDKIWDVVRRNTFGESSFQPTTLDFLFSFLHEKIWLLRVDTNATRKLRKILRLQVPVRYTTIPAGSRIIDSGEKVTSRHLVMLQAMKQVMAEERDLGHPRTIAGSLLFTGILLFTSILFFRCQFPSILESNTASFLITTIVLLCLMLAKLCELFLLSAPHGFVDVSHYPLIVPFAAILLCILLNPWVAIFISTMLAVLLHTCLAFEFQGFLLANLLVSFVCIFYTRTLRRRAELVTVCLRGWVVACSIIVALFFYDQSRWGVSLIGDIGSSAVFMLITTILVVGLLPMFESVFRVLTDINLMEYMNPNQELLQRLMIEAPGTYQHSLLLGSIAEAAAQAIGCNGLFCRVATLYHDIGKVAVAQYFTENQQTGMNIHQLLTPMESARVITSHVSEGVNLARRAGLPEAFIDIIREHHGTSLVYYFYHKQLEAVGHDASLVDDREFRYAGPKPRSKEAAIVMIADSFEAACRSIDEINEEILTRLIDQIVREKVEDGQFDECPLSFEELGAVKKALVKCLLSIGHFRIKYPAKARLKLSPV
jgi:putative nucleotidyltransferase with HDIG domain